MLVKVNQVVRGTGIKYSLQMNAVQNGRRLSADGNKTVKSNIVYKGPVIDDGEDTIADDPVSENDYQWNEYEKSKKMYSPVLFERISKYFIIAFFAVLLFLVCLILLIGLIKKNPVDQSEEFLMKLSKESTKKEKI